MGCRKGEAMSCSAALALAPAPTPLTATAAASRCASSSALGVSSSGCQNPGDSEKDAMPMSISGSCGEG